VPDAIKLVVRQPALLLSPLLDESVDDDDEEEEEEDAAGGDDDEGTEQQQQQQQQQLPPTLGARRRQKPKRATAAAGAQARQERLRRQRQLLLAAWEFGLARDADAEWHERLASLEAYRARHGDCAAGLREGDDASLGRWCALQRALDARGGLAAERREALERAGFVFDADEAEWRRWFLALARFREAHGHASPSGLTLAALGRAAGAAGAAGAGEGAEEGGGASGDGGGETLYLENWCSVQRVARRCRVLSAGREAMLLSLGFDFDGADPLS